MGGLFVEAEHDEGGKSFFASLVCRRVDGECGPVGGECLELGRGNFVFEVYDYALGGFEPDAFDGFEFGMVAGGDARLKLRRGQR